MRGFARDIAWGGIKGEYEPYGTPVVSLFVAQAFPDWPGCHDRLRAGIAQGALFVIRDRDYRTRDALDSLGAQYVLAPKLPGYSEKEMLATMVRNGIITEGEATPVFIDVWRPQKSGPDKLEKKKIVPVCLPSTGFVDDWRQGEMIGCVQWVYVFHSPDDSLQELADSVPKYKLVEVLAGKRRVVKRHTGRSKAE